jgi:glycerophosphoryl diester phosphodiesterase
MSTDPPATRHRTPHPRRRPLLVAALTAAAAAVLVLLPPPGGPDRADAADVLTARRDPGDPAFIVSHRGDRADGPENTLPAFTAALAHGVEFVETDVRLTADGVPVLLHDATVDRTTDGTGAVHDLTLRQLQLLDAGSWFAERFAGTPVPTFGELLDLLGRSDTKAMIELKGRFWTDDAIRALVARIGAAGLDERVVFTSFNEKTLDRLQRLAPGIPRAIAVKEELPRDVVAFVERYDALALMTTPDRLRARPDVVDELHAAGLGVVVFTLNARQRWQQADDLGVDGVVTDRPGDLAAWSVAELAD